MADKPILRFPEFDNRYSINGTDQVLTPALAIYPEVVDSNIQNTVRLLGGNADRWRPHVKTAKLESVIKSLIQHGVSSFKCSTTLELLTACRSGARDVLIAYPVVGAALLRAREIATQFASVSVSALVEDEEQVEAWSGSSVGLFIDINPGMDRTGVEQGRPDRIKSLAIRISRAKLELRGLHYYDGHLSGQELRDRQTAAHQGYDGLMAIIDLLKQAGVKVAEVITAGTPAFPCTLSYAGFQSPDFIHRASPGTVVYCDATSLSQLPADYGYKPAALVVTTVVSHPSATRVTCDAGHKTVSADAGVPTCSILGRPALTPAKPSEEHLPLDAARGADLPRLGEQLYLVPRHVCPTVNNFDYAMIVRKGRIVDVERVTARGREAPLIQSLSA